LIDTTRGCRRNSRLVKPELAVHGKPGSEPLRPPEGRFPQWRRLCCPAARPANIGSDPNEQNCGACPLARCP
jgi:hypothetical protein